METLAVARESQNLLQSEVDAKKLELSVAEKRLKVNTQWVRNIRSLIHMLDGEEMNCEHDFGWEPSSRGVGFDRVCCKCKWAENFEPSY